MKTNESEIAKYMLNVWYKMVIDYLSQICDRFLNVLHFGVQRK